MHNYLDCKSFINKTRRIKLKPHLKSGTAVAFQNIGSNLGEEPVIVSDTQAGNVVSVSNRKKFPFRELLTDIKPFGVAAVGIDKVVVVDGTDQESCVKILTTFDSHQQVQTWKKDTSAWKPRGLAVTKKGHLVVTDVHPSSNQRLEMFTLEGQLVSSFGRAQGPGDQSFRNPMYVTVDTYDRIISTDTDGNCVKIFDSRGRWLKELGGNNVGSSSGSSPNQDPMLNRPLGVCCDNLGNIIVCDSGNYRLAMFSHEGKYIGDLLQKKKKSRPEWPVAVAYSSLTNQLAVSFHDSSNTFKKVVIYEYEEAKC